MPSTPERKRELYRARYDAGFCHTCRQLRDGAEISCRPCRLKRSERDAARKRQAEAAARLEHAPRWEGP